MYTLVDTLFSIYPRVISLPVPATYDDGQKLQDQIIERKVIYSTRQLHKYLKILNGTGNNCYVSIYDINEDVIIDKVVFDLDSGSNLKKSLSDAKKLVNRIRAFSYLPVFSGNKGLHIYLLLKPLKMSREMAGYYVKALHDKLKKGLSTVDPHLIGNISALIRVPNTLNKGRYCTFLPSDFSSMSIDDILEYSKTPHNGTLDHMELVPITDFVNEIDIKPKEQIDIKQINNNGSPSIDILKELIRPCIMEEMLNPQRGTKRGPRHIARQNLVSELLFQNFTEEQVLDVFRKIYLHGTLGDFNEDKSSYQISKIFEKSYKPYSCKKLKEELLCTNCNWRYSW